MTNITDPIVLAQIASLNSQISGLMSAIASGITRASYDGKSVEYRDLASMKMALNFAQVQLAKLLTPNYRKPTAGVAHYRDPFHNPWRRVYR